MQNPNITEYKSIREEMSDLKTCMTHYVQMVLGGSGVIITVFAALSKSSDQSSTSLAFSLLSLAIILVLSCILEILFYKFHSHNRYAGYCKALTVERYTYSESSPEHIILWEVALSDLRRNQLRERKRTESWEYPKYIVAVFIVLILIFSIIHVQNLSDVIKKYPNALNNLSKAMLILIIFLWIHLATVFYKIMWGRNTIEEFTKEFLQIRKHLLKHYGATYHAPLCYPDCRDDKSHCAET